MEVSIIGIGVVWLILTGFLAAVLFSSKSRSKGRAGEATPEAQSTPPLREPARVPRRFGVDVPLIFLTMYAVVLSVVRAYDAYPIVYVIAAVYLTFIIAGQIILAGGRKPRAASIIA